MIFFSNQGLYYETSDTAKFNLPSVKLDLKEDQSNITLTWENVNIYMPKQTKGCITKVTVPSKKIIQNGDLFDIDTKFSHNIILNYTFYSFLMQSKVLRNQVDFTINTYNYYL